MRAINRIVIHCAYTKPSMAIGAADIRRWHVEENGWRDIGYHFVIRRDGTLEKGRPVEQAGAHVAGHNGDSLGVCLVGGMSEQGQPDCNFTRAQWQQLDSLVQSLAKAYGVSAVCGHCDLDNRKPCPCFDVKSWWQGGANG